jgi:hypothetical protein
MRSWSFFFCSRLRGNHNISSVVNAREGMSQIEPGSHPDAHGGAINEAAVGCSLFLFILFLRVGRWGRGHARTSFCCGPDSLAEADRACAIQVAPCCILASPYTHPHTHTKGDLYIGHNRSCLDDSAFCH